MAQSTFLRLLVDIKKISIVGAKIQKASIFEARLGNKENLALKQSTFSLQASRINLADNALVPTWSDTFGRSSATQGTTAAQPTFDIDGLNGKPCVEFTTDDFFSTDVVADSEDATFIFAGRTTVHSATGKILFGAQGTGDTRSYFAISDDGYFAAGAGATTFLTAKSTTRVGYNMTPFVGTITRSGKTIKIRVNGVEEYSATYTGTAINGLNYRLGANNSNNTVTNLFFTGLMGELFFSKKALPLTTIQYIERTLGAKFGISVS